MTFVPRALIAEVTHRCPLRCVYCSNPLEMRSRSGELSTTEWQRVFGLSLIHIFREFVL